MTFKIGQLFMTGFQGTEVPPALVQLLQQEELAGVILFRRNITSLDQLMRLTTRLREAAGRPLLIAVDHEGGRVFRMPPPFTQIPPMARVGAAMHADPQSRAAYEIGRLMGRELVAAGVNVNFAPVLDINTNPMNPIIGDRAFAGERDLVTRCGCDLIRGLLEGGVIPCGKHFPGHGDTPEDSHKTMPVLPHTWDRLRWMELAPFVAAIQLGVPLLMTAHVLYGVIDATAPVTLSKRAISGLLRDELGFKGVIVTDDLEMGAIRQCCPPDEAAVRALAAGCDLALVCSNPEATQRAMARVDAAVAVGTLSAELLSQSALRIRTLATRHAPAPVARTCIGSREHRAVIASLASK